MAKHTDAGRVFIINRVVLSMADDIMYTLAAIYHITYFGLNPLQLVLIGTVHQITVLLCEIPTGLIADLVSRRLSVIIGIFLVGGASLLMGLIPWMAETFLPAAFPLFSLLIVGEVIRGIGVTCISGAQEAWITDEIGEENISGVFMRASQLAHTTGLIGMGISVALSSIALHLPFLVGAIVHVGLGLYALRAMQEKNFHPIPRRGKRLTAAIGATFSGGIRAIRGKQVLMLLMVAAFFAGAASEGFDRLWEAHFLHTITLPQLGNLQPVFWFGLLNLLLGAAALRYPYRPTNQPLSIFPEPAALAVDARFRLSPYFPACGHRLPGHHCSSRPETPTTQRLDQPACGQPGACHCAFYARPNGRYRPNYGGPGIRRNRHSRFLANSDDPSCCLAGAYGWRLREGCSSSSCPRKPRNKGGLMKNRIRRRLA
ncbi:MAG: MFS transporter [Firmicutes bacterium]|nr:MFS transporter [Bacillota bacterium]